MRHKETSERVRERVRLCLRACVHFLNASLTWWCMNVALCWRNKWQSVSSFVEGNLSMLKPTPILIPPPLTLPKKPQSSPLSPPIYSPESLILHIQALQQNSKNWIIIQSQTWDYVICHVNIGKSWESLCDRLCVPDPQDPAKQTRSRHYVIRGIITLFSWAPCVDELLHSLLERAFTVGNEMGHIFRKKWFYYLCLALCCLRKCFSSSKASTQCEDDMCLNVL